MFRCASDEPVRCHAVDALDGHTLGQDISWVGNKHTLAVRCWRQGHVAFCRVVASEANDRLPGSLVEVRLRRRCHRSDSLGARQPHHPCLTTPVSETRIKPQAVFRQESGWESSCTNGLCMILVSSNWSTCARMVTSACCAPTVRLK